MTANAASTPGARRHAYRAWQFTRPFVNVTLILAIILLVLILWLVSTTRSFVDDTMSDVKFGIVEEIEQDARDLVAEVRRGLDELDALRLDIEKLVENPASLIDPQIRRDIEAVKNDADRIASDLDRIATGHIDMSQETLEKLAVSLVRAYGDIRGCTIRERPAKAHGKTAKAPADPKR